MTVEKSKCIGDKHEKCLQTAHFKKLYLQSKSSFQEKAQIVSWLWRTFFLYLSYNWSEVT